MTRTNEPADVFRLYAMGSDDECWPWLGAWGGQPLDKRPYFQANGRRQIAYRWVFELVNGVTLAPDQPMLHSCDQGNYPVGCGNPNHIRLGTVAENNNDAVVRQRTGMPKRVVKAIRTLLEQGKTQQHIADLYGVSREAISAIATQRTHKSVE